MLMTYMERNKRTINNIKELNKEHKTIKFKYKILSRIISFLDRI